MLLDNNSSSTITFAKLLHHKPITMTYTTEVEINAPINKVADLLSDHEQMKHWIKELESYEPISGEPKTPGAKTKLTIKAGPGVEAVETILSVDYPNRFTARYEMTGGKLEVETKLQSLGEAKTKYTLVQNFDFNGPLKLATALMKPAFVRHSEKMIKAFKELAEK